MVGDPRAQHDVGVEAALGHPDQLHVLTRQQLFLGQRVVERRHAERRHMCVGGGELERAPQLERVRAQLVVRNEPQRHRQPGHRMLGQRLRMPWRLTSGQHIADVRLVDHLGAAAVLGRRQADVHVDAERLGDLGAQVLPDGASGHPADHLAEDEAERHHVIALRGAGLPPRLGGRDVCAHRVPIGGVGPMQPGARSDDAGAMPQHHRDGDVVLAGLAELRPVARHRGVQVEFTAVGQQMDAGAGQPLGAGVDAGQGVFLAMAAGPRRRRSRPTD